MFIYLIATANTFAYSFAVLCNVSTEMSELVCLFSAVLNDDTINSLSIVGLTLFVSLLSDDTLNTSQLNCVVIAPKASLVFSFVTKLHCSS